MKRTFLLTCLFLSILPVVSKAQSKIIIEVSAGTWPRFQTPIQASVQRPMNTHRAYYVVNLQTGKKAPAQFTDSATLVFILPDSLPAGKTARYQLLSQHGDSKKIP